MFADLVLAILHHLLVFSLAALLAAELTLARRGLGGAPLAALGKIDAAYGGVAAAVVVVGVLRVMFGLKGWEYYVGNPLFWAKMGGFVVLGLLSVPPTLRIIRWRRAEVAGQMVVPEGEIRAFRLWLQAEAALFALILVFAAGMARGVGY